jgi:endo-1,4-beta-xylanase
MDISIYDYEKGRYQNPPATLIERQAQVYSDYFKMFRDYKDIIETVTLWAVADDATWLDNYPVKNRKDWPMLFDTDRNPKEAFYRILEF